MSTMFGTTEAFPHGHNRHVCATSCSSYGQPTIISQTKQIVLHGQPGHACDVWCSSHPSYIAHGTSGHMCNATCKSYVVEQYVDRGVHVEGELDRRGMVSQTQAGMHQETIGTTKVIERQHAPTIETKVIPVEVKTVKETPATREVVHDEKAINVTEVVTKVKAYGVPGCVKCNGTGMRKSKWTGKLKGCKRCATELGLCMKCNNMGYTMGSSGEKIECKKCRTSTSTLVA